MDNSVKLEAGDSTGACVSTSNEKTSKDKQGTTVGSNASKAASSTDVTLRVGGRVFSQSRAVLSKESPYFQAMFASNLRESREDEVTIEGVDPDIMALLLESVGGKCPHVTEENVLPLLSASDRLQFPNAKEECEYFLAEQISLDNCLGIWQVGKRHAALHLEFEAKKFICRYFSRLSSLEDFTVLDVSEVKEILSWDDLLVSEEETVLRTALAWLEFDQETREKYREEVLSYVRASLLESAHEHHLKDLSCSSGPRLGMSLREIALFYPKDDGDLPAVVYEPRQSRLYQLRPPPIPHGTIYVPSKVLFAVLGIDIYMTMCVATDASPDCRHVVFQYDHVDGTWFPRAPVPCRRFDHPLILVSLDGKLYAMGKLGGIEAYSPELDAWECIDTDPQKSDPPMGRVEHVVGHNGKLMVFSGGTRGVYTYDVTSGEWNRIDAPLSDPLLSRMGENNSFIFNDRVYMTGKAHPQDPCLGGEDYPITFNPRQNQWESLGVPRPDGVRGTRGYVYLFDHVLFVVDGELYVMYRRKTNLLLASTWLEICRYNRELHRWDWRSLICERCQEKQYGLCVITAKLSLDKLPAVDPMLSLSLRPPRRKIPPIMPIMSRTGLPYWRNTPRVFTNTPRVLTSFTESDLESDEDTISTTSDDTLLLEEVETSVVSDEIVIVDDQVTLPAPPVDVRENHTIFAGSVLSAEDIVDEEAATDYHDEDPQQSDKQYLPTEGSSDASEPEQQE
ncbi:KLHL18 [Branchiostoma lanceolatum]|uniref:KLHL18 protein n=1 Tax=Branchiostoma lanceolatum TaxID=7740 RepID=A0A8J9ZZF0_BRALA|nr:KLHL18 [Branchiostoma lanceolatum]